MPATLRSLLVALALLCLPAALAAQPTAAVPASVGDVANPLEPIDTSSPSATYQNFLKLSDELTKGYIGYSEHKTAAKAAELMALISKLTGLFDLEPLPPATRFKLGAGSVGYLLDIMARLPAVPAADIPGAPGRDWGKLPDKWRVPGTAITIARVKDGPRAGDYLFTADTVVSLPEDHALVIGRPPLRPVPFANLHREQINFTGPMFGTELLKHIPGWATRPVLDTPIWKTVLLIGCVLVVLLLTGGWIVAAQQLSREASRERQLALRLSIPLLFLGLYSLIVLAVKTEIVPSGYIALGFDYVSTVLLYVAGAWAAWTVWYLIVELVIASPMIPDHTYDSHLLRLTAQLGATLSAGALIVYGANDIGIPAMGLVAGLGIGGFALALASKSTIENVFAGLAIFADRPFRVGDDIDYGGGRFGYVEAIGTRSTRIRGSDGTLTTVPNADLANLHITNMSNRERCLFSHEVRLRYDTPPDEIERLTHALYDALAAHPLVDVRPGHPRVLLVGFGPSGFHLQLRAQVLTADWREFLIVQQQLLLAALRVVEASGIGFALPSQTIYLARDRLLASAWSTARTATASERTEPPAAGPAANAASGSLGAAR